MGRNWLIYVLGLAGALVFRVFYFGWYSWFLLVLAVCLPVFSLLVSLPAMLRVRIRMDAPASCMRGEPVYVTMQASNGFLPMPRCRFRLRLHHRMTGKTVVLRQTTPGHDSWYVPVETEHCGVLECSVERGWVYDYLGLFCLPVRGGAGAELMICPVAVQPEKLPNLAQFLTRRRRQKPGGGFSEEHELRDYRPGDNLRDMHWKLSVKTDRLIVREAQEPIRGLNLLTLDLRGEPEQVDTVLEQLLWLSRWLLDHDTEHQVIWIDPADCELASAPVRTPEELGELMKVLLRSSLDENTPSIAQRRFRNAAWRYHIQPGQEVQP